MQSWVISQFSRPHGAAGRLAGWIMANRPSNQIRNAETIRLLDLQPHDHVLEIGCGPGLALVSAAERVKNGLVTGLDHSPIMLRQAAKRLRRAGFLDQVKLIEGAHLAAPSLAAQANKIFAVNVVQFLPDRAVLLKQMAKLMPSGGRLALTYQPRGKDPTVEQTHAMAEALRQELSGADLKDIQSHTIDLQPAPAVCVTANKP